MDKDHAPVEHWPRLIWCVGTSRMVFLALGGREYLVPASEVTTVRCVNELSGRVSRQASSATALLAVRWVHARAAWRTGLVSYDSLDAL